MTTELALFTLWERLLGELLDRTSKMPKSARFTFGQRIDNLGLDVVGLLACARYSGAGRKQAALREIDLRLVQLRLLVRLAHDRRLLDPTSYDVLARGLDEAGRMVGGWRAEAARRGAGRPPAGGDDADPDLR